MTPDQIKDEAAVARRVLTEALLATGDEDRLAFGRVYRLTSAKLFGVCLRICGSRQAAEDVLQDVYLTVWRRASGYDPGRSSPITWLATIARNRAIDWRRASGAAPPVRSEEEAAAVVDPAPRPGDVMSSDEGDRLLQRCLEELDASTRMAIRTAFFDGLTYAQLATRADVPVGPMKSRVRRGQANLKECHGED